MNLFLTVITLGVYAAWAKVRNRRYIWANTNLAGQPGMLKPGILKLGILSTHPETVKRIEHLKRLEKASGRGQK